MPSEGGCGSRQKPSGHNLFQEQFRYEAERERSCKRCVRKKSGKMLVERRREHRHVSLLQPCDLVPRACPSKFHEAVPENGSCNISGMHDQITAEKTNKNDRR